MGLSLLKGPYLEIFYRNDQNQNYWDKQNVFIDDIKLSFFDGQDADSLGRGFDEGHYPAAPLFKNSANYERLKKSTRIILYMVNKEVASSICLLILIVCHTIILLKQVMQKNLY